MAGLLGQYSFPVKGNPRFADLGVELDMDVIGDDPKSREFVRRRDLLNDIGTEVAEAYDALVARATEKLVS